jgi:hypothetical protein
MAAIKPGQQQEVAKSYGIPMTVHVVYAIAMIYLSFRLPVVTLGLLGLLLIISSCVRWGLIAGATSSTYASVLLLFSYNLHGGIAANRPKNWLQAQTVRC